MRRYVVAILIVCSAIGLFMSGCDILEDDVLLEEVQRKVINDSTSVRVLNSIPDSTQMVIETTAAWHANVSTGGEWCTLSKYDGGKGKDTIRIFAKENIGTVARQTSIVVESGTNVLIFKVTQSAGENWLDKPYWKRTAAQRLGLHGKVEEFTLTDNWYVNRESVYSFDERGNLLVHRDVHTNMYDTTRTYTYDESNHRISCIVTDEANVVRTWNYVYGNTGKLVAFSANVWNDPDPLAESMEGMIVPDLSAAFKTWKEGNTEFHEDRTYKFNKDETKLKIWIERWKSVNGKHVDLGLDSAEVSYQFSSNCQLLLPDYSKGKVKRTFYYSTGMIRTMNAVDYTYKYLENAQRMVVDTIVYTGDPSLPHEMDSCFYKYNTNRDITEGVKYVGSSAVTVEIYPEYYYDDMHNWIIQCEEVEDHSRYNKREFVYFRR